MSIEKPNFESREQEPHLDLNILSLIDTQTIDEMIDKIEVARKENKIDTVLLDEYDFEVKEVLEELEKIQNVAREQGADIILAPDNRDEKRKASWGQIKQEFEQKGAIIEEIAMPDEFQPVTIGVFVGKNGLTYVFPKTFYLKDVHRPVHKIPDTKIGVTICGEIEYITEEDLDDIDILYNPSREGDDPHLRDRMLLKYGSASKEDIARVLEEQGDYDYLLDNEEEYEKRTQKEDERYFQNAMRLFGEDRAKEMLEDDKKRYGEEDVSVETRRKKFNERVEEHFRSGSEQKDSYYVEHITEVLQKKNIPVVRNDGRRTTGVLNESPLIDVKDLNYKKGQVSYNLIVKK